MNRSIHNFVEIMGRYVSGHTNGNAELAIQQQVWELGWQDFWLLVRTIEIVAERYGFFVQIIQQSLAGTSHPGFGIAIGGSWIAVHRTKVSLPVHQHVTSRKGLRQPHHGIINGRVTMWVVL